MQEFWEKSEKKGSRGRPSLRCEDNIKMDNGSRSPRHGESSDYEWRNGLQIWRAAGNILNKKMQTAEKGWFSSLGVGQSAKKPSP
jgi:hypothetical protein